MSKPAAQYQSLLNMRFNESDGAFLVEGLQVVFPPEGDQRATLSINRASGEEVFSLPLRVESYQGFPAFGKLVPDDEPGGLRVGQEGDFVLTIRVGQYVITRLPFTLKGKQNSDPYDPPKKFIREGPWRDLAYLSVPAGGPGGHVDFNWWMSLRELPAGMNNPLVKVRLMQSSREIASSSGTVVLNNTDWQFFTLDLMQARTAGVQNLTMGALTWRDGDYLVVIEANGRPIKSYRLTIKGGQLQRPDQSRMDFEPHADFISPRLIDTSAGSDSHYLMRDVYWVKRGAR